MKITQRVKKIAIAPEVLLYIGQGKYEVIENEIPITAEVRQCHFNEEKGLFVIYVVDPSFDEVELGGVIPELPTPVIRKLDE